MEREECQHRQDVHLGSEQERCGEVKGEYHEGRK
jgi:hypothetical protein